MEDRAAPEDGGDGAVPRSVVVDGRRWRATDPSIPDAFRRQLVDELMAARRAVAAARRAEDSAAERRARDRVQDAKVALGERGDPWWEEPTSAGQRNRIAASTRALLRARAPSSSICPSDVARAIGGAGWRALLPTVREVAVGLVRDGAVEITQRGETVDLDAVRGPVRIRRGPAFPSG